MSSGERRVWAPDFERGRRRGGWVFGIICDHFDPWGKRPMDRPKLFSHGHLRRAAGPDSGGGALRGALHGDFGPTRRGHGRGFGFEFRPWLAISTERVRSVNLCRVRTRDECTKRSGRSGWTAGRRVFGLADQPPAHAARPPRQGREACRTHFRGANGGRERSGSPKCLRTRGEWGVPAKTPSGVSVPPEKRCVDSRARVREGPSDVSPITVRR